MATDQVGRPEAVTNPSKSIIWQAENNAFNRTVTTDGITLNLGFPGQYHDAETGLWYNGFRDYDARLGRYIESDPMGLNGGLNTYAYVDNNPIFLIDSLGLKCSFAQKISNILNKMKNSAISSFDGYVVSHLGSDLSFSAGEGLGATGDVSVSEEDGAIKLEGYVGSLSISVVDDRINLRQTAGSATLPGCKKNFSLRLWG